MEYGLAIGANNSWIGALYHKCLAYGGVCAAGSVPECSNAIIIACIQRSAMPMQKPFEIGSIMAVVTGNDMERRLAELVGGILGVGASFQ